MTVTQHRYLAPEPGKLKVECGHLFVQAHGHVVTHTINTPPRLPLHNLVVRCRRFSFTRLSTFFALLIGVNMAFRFLLVCFLVLSFTLSSFTKPVEETNGFTSWLKRLESDIRNKILSSGSCDACKLLTFLAQTAFLTNKAEDAVIYESRMICKELKIEDNRVCNEVITEFRNEVLTVTDKVFLSPLEVCGSLLGPTCAHKRDPSEFWNMTLPGKKPPVKPIPPPKVSKSVQCNFMQPIFLNCLVS